MVLNTAWHAFVVLHCLYSNSVLLLLSPSSLSGNTIDDDGMKVLFAAGSSLLNIKDLK